MTKKTRSESKIGKGCHLRHGLVPSDGKQQWANSWRGLKSNQPACIGAHPGVAFRESTNFTKSFKSIYSTNLYIIQAWPHLYHVIFKRNCRFKNIHRNVVWHEVLRIFPAAEIQNVTDVCSRGSKAYIYWSNIQYSCKTVNEILSINFWWKLKIYISSYLHTT